MNPVKILVLFSITLITLQFFPVFGQIHASEEMSNLLEGTEKSDYYSSTKSGSFEANFGNRMTLESFDGDVWIKQKHNVRIEDSNLYEYGTILIEGTLEILETSDPLKAQKIVIAPSGKLIIGSTERPIDQSKHAEIVFVKNQPGETGIFVFGYLSIYGHDIGSAFVELTSDAEPEQEILAVTRVIKDWETQSKILITSPGVHQEYETCTEENEIVRINGVFLYLKEPLECFHRGFNNDFDLVSSHVAILDRNIIISSNDLKNRGSVNFFHGSQGSVKFAEFRDLGPKNVLGRYPIHFHHMEDTSRGIEVEGNSIVNSENRWITIHDSNGILIKNNVGYNSIGHGFFLEDGTEFDNIFENNIGINTRKGEIIPSDQKSAVFWTINPQNEYTNNVAVDGWYYGFHISILNHDVLNYEEGTKENLRFLSNSKFEKNIAYDNGVAGLTYDRKIFNHETTPPIITIDDFKTLTKINPKSKQWGILVRGDYLSLNNAIVIDSPTGIELRGKGNVVETAQINAEQVRPSSILISGIVMAGQNNTVSDSTIKGYFSDGNILPADISLVNSSKITFPIYGYIKNSKLLDNNPIFFGTPANSKSFLQVNGFDAPNSPTKNYPTNFVLTKIDSSTEKQQDLNFFASIEEINDNVVEHQMKMLKGIENEFFSKNELLEILKNKAAAWERNLISNDEFFSEIMLLVEQGIIPLPVVDIDELENNYLEIPSWVKKLVNFWLKNNISDDEFLKAIEFILESQLQYSY